MHKSDMTPTERSSRITWLLMLGWEPTTAQVARRMGITWRSARDLMERLSLAMPLHLEGKYNGVWRLDRGQIHEWVCHTIANSGDDSVHCANLGQTRRDDTHGGAGP